MIATKLLLIIGTTAVFKPFSVEAVRCYMCDTSPTGVWTTIPGPNQRQPDCAKSDVASLARFSVDCNTFNMGFDKCETAFGIGSDGKINRVYRDCINANNRAKIGTTGNGDCKNYDYPPGMSKACSCTGDLCNREDGVNSNYIATIAGRTPKELAAEAAAVLIQRRNITCYLCDTSATGVATSIPLDNQKQADCAKTDKASLAKFAVNCMVAFPGSTFDGCEIAFSYASNGKTVTRVLRDCINSEGRSKIGLGGDGDCQNYNYPPGINKACACTGNFCNRENGVMSFNGKEIASINGMTPDEAAAAEAAVVTMSPPSRPGRNGMNWRFGRKGLLLLDISMHAQASDH
ncbi:hypothetical protein RvY_11682 [Ramazzottius varieornatus]|uniref:Protein sleepless n=1 Tax=Ramazzottius varieornatus TaxID=947166 RepID=A0A1D1VGW6_RAMVA|nr:hypothetical protein RvY_11682 [Ramazzottius varieornatus]